MEYFHRCCIEERLRQNVGDFISDRDTEDEVVQAEAIRAFGNLYVAVISYFLDPTTYRLECSVEYRSSEPEPENMIRHGETRFVAETGWGEGNWGLMTLPIGIASFRDEFRREAQNCALEDSGPVSDHAIERNFLTRMVQAACGREARLLEYTRAGDGNINVLVAAPPAQRAIASSPLDRLDASVADVVRSEVRATQALQHFSATVRSAAGEQAATERRREVKLLEESTEPGLLRISIARRRRGQTQTVVLKAPRDFTTIRVDDGKAVRVKFSSNFNPSTPVLIEVLPTKAGKNARVAYNGAAGDGTFFVPLIEPLEVEITEEQIASITAPTRRKRRSDIL